MRNMDKVREAILEAATYLFERFGYDKTSMDEIARRAHGQRLLCIITLRGNRNC